MLSMLYVLITLYTECRMDDSHDILVIAKWYSIVGICAVS
jgi:hypothetical protein